MSNVATLTAQSRELKTKGALRALRAEGFVPGVVYGGEGVPQTIALSYRDLWKHVATGRFASTLTELTVDGQVFHAIARDIQFDPVRDSLVHIDFMRVDASRRIAIKVPVHCLNHEQSPGLKRGGILNVVVHELEILCPADKIPNHLTIDLTGLNIGDSVHIHQLNLPEGALPSSKDRDLTLITIAGTLEEEPKPEAASGKTEKKK